MIHSFNILISYIILEYSGAVLNAVVLNANHPLHGPPQKRLYVLSVVNAVLNMQHAPAGPGSSKNS